MKKVQRALTRLSSTMAYQDNKVLKCIETCVISRRIGEQCADMNLLDL